MTSPFFSRKARKALKESAAHSDSADVQMQRTTDAMTKGRLSEAQAHLDSATVQVSRGKAANEMAKIYSEGDKPSPKPRKGSVA